MTTNFPTSLDDNTILGEDVANASPIVDPLTNIDATYKNNTRDAVIALQTKVGIDGSADPASLDNRVAVLEASPLALSYLYARLSANQTTNLAVSNHVEFDTKKSAGGDISLSVGVGQLNGIFTLAQDKLYEVEYGVSMEVNEGIFTIDLYDNAGGTPITDVSGITAPQLYGVDNSASDQTEFGTAKTLIDTTGAPLDLEFRITANVNIVHVKFGRSFVYIKKVAG